MVWVKRTLNPPHPLHPSRRQNSSVNASVVRWIGALSVGKQYIGTVIDYSFCVNTQSNLGPYLVKLVPSINIVVVT